VRPIGVESIGGVRALNLCPAIRWQKRKGTGNPGPFELYRCSKHRWPCYAHCDKELLYLVGRGTGTTPTCSSFV
jgi:hypothetical protein